MSTSEVLIPEVPPFAAPWQAHAFALTLALHERGVFSWPQWTAALAATIARAQARGEPDDGHTYYHHWLDALKALLQERGLADAATLHALEHAWEDAAARTLRGLARGAVRIAYPLPLYLMARIAGGMPPSWRNALFNRLPAKQALD